MLLLLLSSLTVWAEEPEEEERRGPPMRPFFIQLRYTPSILFPTEFRAADGRLTTYRQDVTGTVVIPIRPVRGRLNLSVSREWHRYRFVRMEEDISPFSDVYSTSLSAVYMGALAEDWSVFAMGRVSWEAEREALRSDGRSEGGQVLFQRRFHERLTLGAGGIVATRLNEDLFLIPIASIRWAITDRVTLQTMRGLNLFYTFDEARHWTLGLNAEYHSTYFRLNDKAFAPGGVFRQRNIVSTVSLMYQPNPGIQVGAEIGYVPWRQIKISDAEERTLLRSKTDPGFSAAFTAALTF